MKRIGKTSLIALAAGSMLVSSALAQGDEPQSALSFGGRSSPFISPSDFDFGRPHSSSGTHTPRQRAHFARGSHSR